IGAESATISLNSKGTLSLFRSSVILGKWEYQSRTPQRPGLASPVNGLNPHIETTAFILGSTDERKKTLYPPKDKPIVPIRSAATRSSCDNRSNACMWSTIVLA